MNTIYPVRKRGLRPTALLTTALLSFQLLAGCGGRQSAAPPPVDDTNVGMSNNASANQPQAKKGLTTTQKVAILAGAAALYYLYNKHKNAQGHGPEGQYYLSKNGRVYYRDAEHRAHWVTPPQDGIQVPEAQARQYRDFQGYNNRSTGRDLSELGPASVPAQ